jgi:hypothetical protein
MISIMAALLRLTQGFDAAVPPAAARQLGQRHEVRAGHVADEILGRLAHIEDRAAVGLRGPELLQVCFLYHDSS